MSGPLPDAPVRLPVSVQAWEDLTFLHWAYPPEQVQRLLPPGLTVQEQAGRAWVGVSPFRMADVRAPGLPPPPGWSAFGELNVRLYVRGPDGRDGIWFPLLLASRATFVTALRTVGLPYRTARAEAHDDGTVRRYSFLPAPGAPWGSAVTFRATVEITRPPKTTQRTPVLDSLAGRWNAYHCRFGVLWRTPVAHQPWTLMEATATGDLSAPLTAVGLPAPDDPPLVHAARTVHARLGVPRPAAGRHLPSPPLRHRPQ